MVSFKPGLLFYLEFTRETLGDLLKDLHAKFGSYDLSSPEIHNDLRLVPAVDKPVDIPDLQVQVMLVYLRPHLDLFHVDCLSLRVLLAVQLLRISSVLRSY